MILKNLNILSFFLVAFQCWTGRVQLVLVLEIMVAFLEAKDFHMHVHAFSMPLQSLFI